MVDMVRRQRMKITQGRGTGWLWIGIGAAMAWLVFAPPGWAREIVAQGTTPAAQPAQGDVASLLAPMLAAATGIERVLEMAWNWLESANRQLIATMGLGGAWADYAHQQVRAAEDTLRQLART